MTRIDHMVPDVRLCSRTAKNWCFAVVFVLTGFVLAGPAHPQGQYPAPAEVKLRDEALSAVAMTLEPGNPDYLVCGTAEGGLSLHNFSPSLGRFLQISNIFLGGRIVDLIPWEERPLQSQGVVAACVDIDMLVFLEVLPESPYLTIRGAVELEENPGTLSFLGELVDGKVELAVSLPGIDQVAFLEQEDETWNIVSVLDAGDRPHSILGIDLDGDQVRELVTANQGPLSGNLGIFRRNSAGQYVGTMQDFPAGAPNCLAGHDIDNDGVLELAATVEGSPQLVLMRPAAGQLVPSDVVGLSLPATDLHFSILFDGTIGLFSASGDRGLVDFFQLQQNSWIWRNSYYPACLPVALTSGEFNGDNGRDLVTVGGDSEKVTVMFANSQPGFWGYPSMVLNAGPVASAVADFNGDGRPDLVVANEIQTMLSFFPGLVGGGFSVSATDVPLSFYPGEMAVINADAEAGPELAILDSVGDQVVLADFVSGQGFTVVSQTSAGASPFYVLSADLDVDGFEDLLVINQEDDEVRLLFGAGDHTFPAWTDLGLGNSAIWGETLDLNADGLPDLALTDGVNRVWTQVNQGDRTFGELGWLVAGLGAGIMAVGDIDQDLDEDIAVVNKSDESVSLFENTGTGVLTRRIGALTLGSAPSDIVIQDMDQDGRAELVMNLRQESLVGVLIPLGNWEFAQPTTFYGGPDVRVFDVGDYNHDDVPDIMTLDHSLLLGLTLLNVEQEMVAVEPAALAVECGSQFLVIRIQPDRTGSWNLDLRTDGRWIPLAVSGQAYLGEMDYDNGTWILTVDRRVLPESLTTAVLRLTVGDGSRRETLDLSLDNLCPEAVETDLPAVAWAREPWPNPFNPLVNFRFALSHDAEVQVGVYDLAGRQVAVLADGWFAAGDHTLKWDGRDGGRPAGAGVYLLRIRTPKDILLHKVMLVK